MVICERQMPLELKNLQVVDCYINQPFCNIRDLENVTLFTHQLCLWSLLCMLKLMNQCSVNEGCGHQTTPSSLR